MGRAGEGESMREKEEETKMEAWRGLRGQKPFLQMLSTDCYSVSIYKQI